MQEGTLDWQPNTDKCRDRISNQYSLVQKRGKIHANLLPLINIKAAIPMILILEGEHELSRSIDKKVPPALVHERPQ